MPDNKKNAHALSDRALELVMHDVLEGVRARSLQQSRYEIPSLMKIGDQTPDKGSRLYAVRSHPESNRKAQQKNCRKLNS